MSAPTSGPAARPARRRYWVLAACAAAVLALVAAPAAGASPAQTCDQRANDTAAKLVECVTTADLWGHLTRFQAIADSHPSPADGRPSRNSGEPGYQASVDYVAKVMTDAGYAVTVQTYHFPYFAYRSRPALQELRPAARDLGLGTDWIPVRSVGVATADVQPAGAAGAPAASGCAAADFAGFTRGRIALVRLGSCAVTTVLANAQAAGASGVVMAAAGDPGSFPIPLTDAAGRAVVPTVPVALTGPAVGQQLEAAYVRALQAHAALPRLRLAIDAVVDLNAEDYNVIAESRGGDPNHVVVVDAHLDAIYGAGILDNASGSATVLDVAQQLRHVTPRNKLRFVWFGGEELGLLGSQYYVGHLTPAERARIGYDLDADVTATPNYLIGVLDPQSPDLFGRAASNPFPDQVEQPSRIARDVAVGYFDSVGLHHVFLSPAGTDAFSFNTVGIPASGLLTGQDCCKLQSDVDLFGGRTGNFEGTVPGTDGGCVDQPWRWCDNLANNDPKVLTFMSKAFATMVVHMAFAPLPPPAAPAPAPASGTAGPGT